MKTFISSHFIFYILYHLLLVLFANLIVETLDFVTILDWYYMCWLAFWQAQTKTCMYVWRIQTTVRIGTRLVRRACMNVNADVWCICNSWPSCLVCAQFCCWLFIFRFFVFALLTMSWLLLVDFLIFNFPAHWYVSREFLLPFSCEG